MIRPERIPTSETSVPTHERVFRALRARIMHGEIVPGQAMTIRGIAEEFEVSMTPAREAVRRLTAEGALSMSKTGRVTAPLLSTERIEEFIGNFQKEFVESPVSVKA